MWEYKYTAPVTTDWLPLTSNNTTATQFTIEHIPGSFTIRCTLELSGNFQNPNPSPIVLEKNITVPKPDEYTLTGTGVSTALNSDCVLTFHVTQGGNSVSYIGGFAQERIRNLKLYDYAGNVYATPPDTDWIPVDSNDQYAMRFIIVGGNIEDAKFYNDDGGGYNNRPVNDTLETLDQDIRIKFTYPGGYIDYAYLPSLSFTFRKSDMNMYKVD